jgi:hypothetical protein
MLVDSRQREAISFAFEHRVPLADDWSIWRTICVRATGFPFASLHALTAPELAARADRAHASDAAVEVPLRAAKAHVSKQLRAKVGSATDYRRALRRLRQRQLPAGLEHDEQLIALLANLSTALTRARDHSQTYDDAYREHGKQMFRHLQDVAREPRFREAISWQNLSVVERALEPFIALSADTNNKAARRTKRVVARYLQRYCARNESIGFFGPVAWGTFRDDGAPLVQRSGVNLIDRHAVHLEYWAARAAITAITSDPAIKQWLRPRRYPGVVSEGMTAVGTFGQRATLTPAVALVVDACNGLTTVDQLVQQLAARFPDTFSAPADVHAALEQAVSDGLVIWEPQLPLCGAPEQQAFRFLTTISEQHRGMLLAKWARFQSALTTLGAAFGDADKVRTGISALNQHFEHVTGKASVRNPGKAYAGRTLAFLDCSRDYDLTLGPAIRERLAPALSLVLDSVRWYTAQLGAQFLDFVGGQYDAVCRSIGSTTVPLGMLWSSIQAHEPIARAVVDDVLEQLHERWAELLHIGPDESAVQRTSRALAGRAKDLFTAPAPGWPGARHHSPDVMIGARSDDEIRNGGGYFVLGEIHVGVITINQQNFLEFHPDPSELMRAAALDRGEPEVEPVRTMEKGGQRVGTSGDSGVNFQLEYDDTPAWFERDRVLSIAEVFVESSAAGLMLRTRDGAHRFPAASFFGRQTLGLFMQRFGLFAPQAHRPRICIDDLVISRESWRFSRDALSFAVVREDAERYRAARAFMHRHRLPQFMFYRIPGEPKPIYLDWASPSMVDLLAHAIRGSSNREEWSASFTEMLPGPDDLWLIGPGGERYTSELRLTVLDRRGLDCPPQKATR